MKLFQRYNTKPDIIMKQKRTFYNLIINSLLLVSGLVLIFSGLALQIGFHMGGPHEHQIGTKSIQSPAIKYEQLREIDPDKIVFGLTTRHGQIFINLLLFSFRFL